MNRTALAIFATGLACSTLLVGAGLAGCQSETSSSSTDGAGAGDTSSGTESSSSIMDSASSSSDTSSTSTSTSSSSGGATCDGQAATIQDITSGKVGAKVKVKLTGVVAMSQKFLVSKSSKGSCLWGMYISAPGLAETAPGTGILALSYGNDAQVPDGGNKAYCPRLGIDPIGDDLPDDAKPGDVLDIIGSTDAFVLPACANEPGGTTVAQFQLTKVCQATKTGTTTPPKAHVLTAAEAAKLADQGDKAFHDQWGGTKVRIENVNAVAADAGAVGAYGAITLDNGLQVADSIYYQAYKKSEMCHTAPQFAGLSFQAIEGFNAINYCTWSFYPNSKCDDFAPPSDDCGGKSCK